MSTDQRTDSPPPGRPRGRPLHPATDAQLSGHAAGPDGQDMVLAINTRRATLTTRLLRLANRLGPGDLAVLYALAALRLATATQLRRLVFTTGPDHTQPLRARRCLQRLHTLGLVVRLGRNVGGQGAGSTSYTYHLTPDAQRLVGVPTSSPQSLQGARDHTLAISELAVTLHEAHRAGSLELLAFEPEPQSWRTWTHDGHRRHVRPDAFLIIAQGDWEHLWFIELDRGTQSPATIRRKAHAYHTYAQTGHEQAKHGVYPRTAYLTTHSPDRCRALARALADTPQADQLTTVGHLDNATHALAHPTTTATS